MTDYSADFSWTGDPSSDANLAADLAARMAGLGGQVPSAHGPEPKILSFGVPGDTYQPTLDARCCLEFIVYNTHGQPSVEVCRYPWHHGGGHGVEIPELYAAWDAMATQIEDTTRYA